MVAAWMGNTEVVKALFELGADTEKVDGNGLTAFQIALAQTDRSESLCQKEAGRHLRTTGTDQHEHPGR